MSGTPYNAPIMVLNQNTQRESGRKAQMANINAAQVIPIYPLDIIPPNSLPIFCSQ